MSLSRNSRHNPSNLPSAQSEKDFGDFLVNNQVARIDTSLNSIHVVGANIGGLGLLNATRVLLAFIASTTDPDNSKITILDLGESDFYDILDSPFLNGGFISSEEEILTELTKAANTHYDFRNIIILNHYDWLKNPLKPELSIKIKAAVDNLVRKAQESNVLFIIVDRNIGLDEKLPDTDAVLCFHLNDERLSMAVLGQAGAEKLKTHGDTLYFNRKTGDIQHGQIPLIKDELFADILRTKLGTTNA